MRSTTWSSVSSLNGTMPSSLLHRQEKIVGRDALGRQALLVDVTAERIPGRAGLLQAIGPEVVAEDAAGFLDVVDQERQRHQERIGVVIGLEREIARLQEGAVETLRHEGVLFMHCLADDHRVHDREDLRSAVIFGLDVFEVWKQPRDFLRAGGKKLREVDREQRVEVIVLEHSVKRFAGI